MIVKSVQQHRAIIPSMPTFTLYAIQGYWFLLDFSIRPSLIRYQFKFSYAQSKSTFRVQQKGIIHKCTPLLEQPLSLTSKWKLKSSEGLQVSFKVRKFRVYVNDSKSVCVPVEVALSDLPFEKRDGLSRTLLLQNGYLFQKKYK